MKILERLSILNFQRHGKRGVAKKIFIEFPSNLVQTMPQIKLNGYSWSVYLGNPLPDFILSLMIKSHTKIAEIVENGAAYHKRI
jgi:hypothetical protein